MILRIARYGLLMLAGLSLAAVADDEKDNEQLTRELGVAQQQLATMQQDMVALRRLLDNRGLLELFQRMDELADEVSHLRGMIEQQEHETASIKKRQRELYLDSDRRLRQLESTGGRQAGPASLAGAEPVAADATTATTQTTPDSQTAESGAVVEPEVTSPPVVAVPSLPLSTSSGSTGTRPPVSEERDEYQAAFDMLKEGRYKMANTSFKAFLKKYPNSSYAGNAQYWLGESNYVTRQFEQAITEFSTVVEQYPRSNKVADAMLKLGYTYYELARFDEARQVLDQLSQYAPNSTAARLAGKRLERMRRENR